MYDSATILTGGSAQGKGKESSVDLRLFGRLGMSLFMSLLPYKPVNVTSSLVTRWTLKEISPQEMKKTWIPTSLVLILDLSRVHSLSE